MNTNYAQQIVTNLEKKGESKDFIIGFLAATIDGLRHLENKKVHEYMEKTIQHSKR